MENKTSDGSDKAPEKSSEDIPFASEYNKGQKLVALVEIICYTDFPISNESEAVGVVKSQLSSNGQEFGNISVIKMEPYDPDEDEEEEA